MSFWHIRPLGRHELPLVCSLFESSFGHARSPAEWQWKFFDAPALGTVNLVAAGTDGLLIAHAGAMVFEGRLGDQPLRYAHACDVMVHPSARADLGPANVYRPLMHALDAALHAIGPADWPLYTYGFPGERPARLGERLGLYRRLGVCQVRHYAPPPPPLRRGLARRIADGLARWVPPRWQATPLPWDDIDAAVTASRRVGAVAGHPHADPHAAPTLCKTTAYLRWRYARHPALRYQFWQLRARGGAGCGWLVTRPAPAPALVVDGVLPAGLALSDALAALARASGVSAWHTWLDGDLPAEPTPIIAVEFSARAAFHPDWPPPRFQPGDTDVF